MTLADGCIGSLGALVQFACSSSKLKGECFLHGPWIQALGEAALRVAGNRRQRCLLNGWQRRKGLHDGQLRDDLTGWLPHGSVELPFEWSRNQCFLPEVQIVRQAVGSRSATTPVLRYVPP